MSRTRFESIGTYYPEKIVSTEELINQMEHKPQFDFQRLTGVNNRRWKREDEDTLSMALMAANDCLAKSRYSAKDMDIIISCSISRIHGEKQGTFEPPMSLLIKNQMGAHSAINFDIGNACAGTNTGIYILDNMIKTGAVKRGMVVSAEATTPGVENALKEIKDPVDEQFATLTMGDAAAAIIMDESLNQTEGIDFIDFTTVAHYADLCFVLPSTKNSGWVMYTDTIGMQSKDLLMISPKYLVDIFSKYNRTFNPDDYDFLIYHQVSSAALKAYAKALQSHLKTELPATLTSLEEFGNTASTTHWVVIANALKAGKIKKGSRILLGSSASGIVMGLISFTLGDLEV